MDYCTFTGYFMTPFFRSIGLLCFFVLAGFQIGRAQQIGSWTDHLSYRNTVDVAVGDCTIVTSTEKALFYYSLDDFSLSKLSKANGLSDISDAGASAPQRIDYYPEKEVLLVAYTNGNIDLVEKGSQVYNISNLKDAIIVGAKRINHIHFDGDYAYLGTTLGVMVIDLVNRQIQDTYKVGPSGSEEEVFATTTVEDTIYAGTEFGVYKAPNDGTVNLLNFAAWELLGPAEGIPAEKVQNLITFNGEAVAQIDDVLYREQGKQWTPFYGGSNWKIIDLTGYTENLLTTEIKSPSGSQVPDTLRIGRITPVLDVSYPVNPKVVAVPRGAVESSNGDIWIADFFQGLIKYTPSGHAYLYPNGPATSRVFDMDAGPGGLWVAPGGVESTFDYNFIRDGYFQRNREGFWTSYDAFSVPELADQLDNIAVEVDDNTGVAYLGSYYNGVLKIDPPDYTLFTKDNTSLQGPTSDPNRTTVSGLVLDEAGNLWVGNNNVADILSVIKPDGSSRSFGFPGISQGSEVVVDQFNQKWIMTPRNSSVGLVVFDHGSDIDNTGDDQYFIAKKGQGQGNLHSTEVTTLAVDNDGEIWCGTTEGITVFYCPGQVFFGGCEATRILIEQDGEFNYLLESEVVNTIAVDGANRKWIGTNNGAFLMSEDGQEQIEYFNIDNSPLLSNAVLDIAVDDQTGEVYFGTDKGIISYIGTATETSAAEECRVYPNPVREDYKGPITIDDVPLNADVKITDANGVKVYETESLGSRVIWDGNNYNGERAVTGVYLIFISDEEGNQRQICRLLLVN